MVYYIHKDKLNLFIESTRYNKKYVPKFWKIKLFLFQHSINFFTRFFKKSKFYKKNYIYIFLKYIIKKFFKTIG